MHAAPRGAAQRGLGEVQDGDIPARLGRRMDRGDFRSTDPVGLVDGPFFEPVRGGSESNAKARNI